MFLSRKTVMLVCSALALTLALPVGAQAFLDDVTPPADEEPVKKKDGKKKDEVTVWVLQAKGPS